MSELVDSILQSVPLLVFLAFVGFIFYDERQKRARREKATDREDDLEDLGIEAFMHCGQCVDEIRAGKADDMSPADYAHLNVGWTKYGIQIWCERHDCNVLHIDFEGQKHPASTKRNLDRPELH